jgi:hypothetical protein
MRDNAMLTTSPEKICYIIVKAREYDAKSDPVETDQGLGPADELDRELLGSYSDDATYQELAGAIESMNEDELVELLALGWFGRSDEDKESWGEFLEQARQNYNERTVGYLLGTPLLSDYLEEGLSRLGYSIEEFEAERL